MKGPRKCKKIKSRIISAKTSNGARECTMNKTKNKNPFISDRLAIISKDAVELLGYQDRMLYRSKSLRNRRRFSMRTSTI